MFSRFNLFFLSLILLIISSCGLKIGEKSRQKKAVEIKTTACIDSSVQTINQMFKAQALDQQIAPAIECFSSAILNFTTNVQGENKNYFTADEIVYFLNKNFLKKDKKINLDLVNQLMIFKVSVLGGNDYQLTKTELTRLSQIIEIIKPEIVNINSSMDVLTKNWNFKLMSANTKELQFKTAVNSLDKLTDLFFAQFSKQHSEYDINQGLNLIKEFMRYTKDSQDSIDNLEKYRKLIFAIKNNLISPTAYVKPSDWMKISKSLSSTIHLILREEFFTQNYNTENLISADNKTSKYGTLIQDISLAISQVLALSDNKKLTLEQMTELFDVSFKAFSVDLNFSLATVKTLTQIKNALILQANTNENTWDKTDFNLLSSQLEILFVELGNIRNIIHEMDKDNSWKTNYPLFQKFESQISQSADHLIQIFQGQYDIDNVKSLIATLKETELIESTDLSEKYDKYNLTLMSLKKLITNNENTLLLSTDLKNILFTGKNIYLHYLEYQNYIEPIKYSSRAFPAAAINILPKIVSTLNTSLDLNAKNYFSTENILLAYEAYRVDFEKKAFLTDDSLRIVFNALYDHILIKPEHRQAGFVLAGFNKEAVSNIEIYANHLFNSNRLINDIISPDELITQVDLVSRIHSLINSTKNTADKNLLTEISSAFSGNVPLSAKNNFLKIFDSNSNIFTADDLRTSHLARLISRILIHSYSLSLENISYLEISEYFKSASLTLEELEFTFVQLRTVLIELDLVNPTNEKFMTKRFREADLFTTRSNGDGLAQYLEIHDLIIHIMSGTARAEAVHDQIFSQCLTPEALPLNRYTEIGESCLQDVYFKYDQGFEFLPSFIKLKSDMGETIYKDHAKNLLVAAGYIPNDRNIVLLDDADNFPHIVQYIEMMFAQFDADKDGHLIKEEALMAFPVYKKTIQKVVSSMSGGEKIKEAQLPGVFIYFLRNGHGPRNVIEKLQFMAFINDEKKWIVNASRFDVGIVFKFIAEAP